MTADAFNSGIDAYFRDELPEAVAKFQRGLTLEAHARIVDRTPVLDGQLRGSWQVDFDAPVGGSGGVVDTTGAASKAAAQSKVAQLVPYQTAFVATNMPQAPIIEEGKYPQPVKRGTRIRQAYLRKRRRKHIKSGALPPGTDPNYEIRSAGGFSKQAPEGVVAPVVRELQSFLEG